MSDPNNDRKIYNASEIQRYLNGQMSAAEMHALEYSALEDPFLADTIEGYDHNKFYKETDMASDVEDLHSRLASRITSKYESNVVPLFKRSWWKVAAMILVAAGSASMVYYLIYNNTSSNEAVIATYKAPEQTVTKADTIVKENINTIDSASVAVASSKLKPASSKMLRRSEPMPDNTTASVVTSAPSPALSSAPVISKPDSIAAENVPEARVATLPESKIMQSKSATTSLFDTGKKKEDEVSKRSRITQDAAPVIGWPAFNRYLENNKRMPADSNRIPGEVIVSFIVREDGELSDFKIEKSLSKQSDNEAVRLIKEGPAWKVLRNQRVKATITITF